MKPIISKLIAYVVENCSTIDMEERFCAMLDECYSFKGIGGPFEYMQPSRVLRECDPVAFRCWVSDMDNADVYKINGDYYDRREVDDCQGEFVDELDNRETDLSVELEAMEEKLDEEDQTPDEYTALRDKVKETRAELQALQADLDEARRYSF